MVFLKEFFKKVDFEKNQQTTKSMKTFPGGKEFNFDSLQLKSGPIRPLVKSMYQKINFLIFQPKHVVGTQKSSLIETVLLSTQYVLKLMGKEISLRSKILLI